MSRARRIDTARWPRLAALAALAAVAAGLAGCAQPPLATPVGRSARPVGIAEPPAAPQARPPTAPEPEPEPAARDTELVELGVPGFGRAIVVVPRREGPRPLLVAAHGAGDRPEWLCDVWRALVNGSGYVLCPRGRAIDARVPEEHQIYYYPDHHALGREIDAALAALEQRFGARVDFRAPVFTGFSQGAIMGALLLPRHPARFTRAALVEGGYGSFDEWTLGTSRRWRREGGARVLLACGRFDCAAQARRTQETLERGGLLARVLHAVGAGHTYGGVMERELQAAFRWLVEDDPRWAEAPSESAPTQPG